MENTSLSETNLDAIRQKTLAQIEQIQFYRKVVFGSIMILEIIVIALFVWLGDVSNRTHLLIFIGVIGVWAMIGLSLIVLGILQKEHTLRILNAIESLKD